MAVIMKGVKLPVFIYAFQSLFVPAVKDKINNIVEFVLAANPTCEMRGASDPSESDDSSIIASSGSSTGFGYKSASSGEAGWAIYTKIGDFVCQEAGCPAPRCRCSG